MIVEATAVVNFGTGGTGGDPYLLFLDIDSLDIDGSKKTSFAPGENAIIQVNHSRNIKLTQVIPTDGSIYERGSVVRSIVNRNLFLSKEADNPSEYTLPIIPITTNVSYIGRTGSLVSEESVEGIVKLVASTSRAPFIAEITSSYNCSLYELFPPDLDLEEGESYSIAVVFYFDYI